MTNLDPGVRHAQACARFFHGLGYNPLPSRTDRKGPALASYSEYHLGSIPPGLLDAWTKPNVQVVLGVRWRLAVVDLDGPEGQAVWRSWAARHATPATWTVRTGSGGIHLWWGLPEGLAALPWRRLWGEWDPAARSGRGDWAKHRFVELLGDGRLAIAPPSRHVETGRPYEFLPGHGPRDLARPAEIPAWLLDLPHVEPPAPSPPPSRPRRPSTRCGGRVEARDVLDAIPAGDKLALARSWGLRVRGGVNPSGWASCHDPGREDRRPSAMFRPESGVLWTPGEKAVPFFELAVRLGAYATWLDALHDLASRYGRRRGA